MKPTKREPKAPIIPSASSPEERICTTFCEDNSRDSFACRTVCLNVKERNHGLYHRALYRAQVDGLAEPHAHIFAAGAVWSWLEMTGLVKEMKK